MIGAIAMMGTVVGLGLALPVCLFAQRFLSPKPYVPRPRVMSWCRDGLGTRVGCRSCDWSTASYADERLLLNSYHEHWQRHHAAGVSQ